jgi:hypothetical protein
LVPFVAQQEPPFALENASLLKLSAAFNTPWFPAATWLGVLAYEGGTSMTGLLVKKLRGRNNSVMGSAGMTGKSSGAGKCDKPQLCQSTI